jgi:hypothetical protein
MLFVGKARIQIICCQTNQVTFLPYFPGVLSHKAVREKIVRAFLIEEQKLVNLLMRDQGAPKAEK